jgi:hypothetical protein
MPKNKFGNLFDGEEDGGEAVDKQEQPAEKKFDVKLTKVPKKTGKVANIIVGKRIIVDVNGNGESIDYNADLHANLHIGDLITL